MGEGDGFLPKTSSELEAMTLDEIDIEAKRITAEKQRLEKWQLENPRPELSKVGPEVAQAWLDEATKIAGRQAEAMTAYAQLLEVLRRKFGV